MSNDKIDLIKTVTEKYAQIDEGDKKYILGYMEGVQKERAAWLHKMQAEQQPA